MATLNDLWDTTKGPDRRPFGPLTTDALAALLLKWPAGTPVSVATADHHGFVTVRTELFAGDAGEANGHNGRVAYEQLVDQVGQREAQKANGACLAGSRALPAGFVIIGVDPNDGRKELP